MNETGIKQLNLADVPHITPGRKYYDGEIGFADDITEIIHLVDAFKVNFLAMVFCTSGSVSMKINSENYDIKANDGLLIDMQSVVSDIRYSSDMHCKVICISLDSGVTFLNKSVFEAFLRIKNHPVVHFSANEMELMSRYYELAMFKMEHPETGASGKESIHMILRAYVLDMIANVNVHMDVPREGDNILRQSDKIFQRFIIALAESNGVQRSVKDYASELCVSPKYLTSICRKQEGKTAGELIVLNTVGHIKQLLLYSPLSIKEIATQLGFDNLSFFGKYVKKHLGESPNNYRKTHGYGK
jgi:AraC-like DNA-binding protein